MMKAIIIDDEASARSILSNLLEEHCPEVHIVDMAVNIPSGVLAINTHKPDVVFLDIEMPQQSGFQLFDFFEEPDFQVIFTTAYSEYALRAFEVSAIDYLIKPLQINKLKISIDKALTSAGKTRMKEQLNILKKALEVNRIQRVALPMADGMSFVKIDDIIYLQAKGAYTTLVSVEQEILLSKKIKDFEYLLNENMNFFRIHRSYVVNIKHIKRYVKHEGLYVHVENDVVLPVARERKQAFEDIIKNVLIGQVTTDT